MLRRFDQRDFIDANIFNFIGLADYGYVYYPYRCIDGTVSSCKVHMVLPGCGQTQALNGYNLMDDYGYNHYAASNDLIMIYP